MAGKEWKAQDKTVHKMTRAGLVQENLHTGQKERLTDRETDEFRLSQNESEHSPHSQRRQPLPRQPDQMQKSIHQQSEVETQSEPYQLPKTLNRVEEKQTFSSMDEQHTFSSMEDVPFSTEQASSETVTEKPAFQLRSFQRSDLPQAVGEPVADDVLRSDNQQPVGVQSARMDKVHGYSLPKTLQVDANGSDGNRKSQQKNIRRGEEQTQTEVQGSEQAVLPEDSFHRKNPHEPTPFEALVDLKDGDVIADTSPDSSAEVKPRAKSKNKPRASVDKPRLKPEGRLNFEEEPTEPKSDRDSVKAKVKKDRVYQEQRKKKADAQSGTESQKKSSRLSFDDEQNGMVKGSGMGFAKTAAKRSAVAVGSYVHSKVHQVEKENSSVEATHKSELVAEQSLRSAAAHANRKKQMQSARGQKLKREQVTDPNQRLKFGEADKAAEAGKKAAETGKEAVKKNTKVVQEAELKKSQVRKFFQKKKYKDAYRAVRKNEKNAVTVAKNAETVAGKIKRILINSFREHKTFWIAIAVGGLLFLIISASVTSCSVMFQGGANTFISTTYPSTDDDIYAAENAYVGFENALNRQINQMESTHPGYDEYRYSVDEISHNPYQLVSYLTTVYGEYTYDQVEDVLEALFQQQYRLAVSESVEIRTRTETRTREVEVIDPETGEVTIEEEEYEVEVEYEYKILNISLTNLGFDVVARNNLSGDDLQRYELYKNTYGNRDYLFDVNTLPSYGGSDGFGYEIPAEALTDEKFANMIHEAERYLGYPYVWGGSSPSTSFDCSGFVSWVINHCGNGWDVGRLGADGLRSVCSYVSPADAKPGDLIFFQGTYDTTGASHVGIYVGNQTMIHCGNPIQYTSIASSYWQEHFLAFGRIH